MVLADAVLGSWRLDPVEILLLAGSLLLYLRGFGRVRVQMPDRFPPWRAWCFGLGLLVVWVAIASPLDTFAGFLFWTHMVQHLLLMFVAPPLLLLGSPALPFLRGLPESVAKEGAGRVLRQRRWQNFFHRLTHPVVCWSVFVLVTWVWHAPALYDLALRNTFWHGAEHLFFLAASLLFWWPVVQPWPSKPHWPRLAMVPYLLLADVQASVLSAIFSFSSTPIYPTYAAAPRIGSLSPLEDQALAGALMWVPGTVVLLTALLAVVVDALSPNLVRRPGSRPEPREGLFERLGGTRAGARRFDLLRVAGLGGLLRSLRVRRMVQFSLFLLALLVVADGWWGDPESGRNLAGVLPWTYWRAFVVVGLLVAGNIFCFACPFLLPRELARKFLPEGRRWPRALRSKWLALALLAAYLVAYEVLGIWDSPFWTAWIIVGYFAVALLVDGFFRGAPFCKWVCPIGQFHFIQSMVSPLSVEVRDPATCGDCRTRDCLVGNEVSRGCELDLYLPRKVGSLDCTFCLDCVRACPEDNIGILATSLARETIEEGPRASIGRLAQRPDLAALAALLISAAFVSAVAMTAPFVAWEEQLVAGFPQLSPEAASAGLLLLLLIGLPLLLIVVATILSRRLGHMDMASRAVACSFVFPLIPLGLSMWCAHFLFHFASGWNSVWPVAIRGMRDLGWDFEQPLFILGHASHGMQALGLLLLDIGLLLSLWRIWQCAGRLGADPRRAEWAALPWSVVAVLLFLCGVWITFQPMEMRGLLLLAGGGN